MKYLELEGLICRREREEEWWDKERVQWGHSGWGNKLGLERVSRRWLGLRVQGREGGDTGWCGKRLG